MELGIACGGGSIGDDVGDGVKAVDNGVSWCDGWDGEVVMTEVDCVRDAKAMVMYWLPLQVRMGSLPMLLV